MTAELRHLADLMIWARSTVTEPWNGAPDYEAGSAHEHWLAACDPATIAGLLDVADAARALMDAGAAWTWRDDEKTALRAALDRLPK